MTWFPLKSHGFEAVSVKFDGKILKVCHGPNTNKRTTQLPMTQEEFDAFIVDHAEDIVVSRIYSSKRRE